jgi:hypothetical protein
MVGTAACYYDRDNVERDFLLRVATDARCKAFSSLVKTPASTRARDADIKLVAIDDPCGVLRPSRLLLILYTEAGGALCYS